jgi:uncharacterized protein with ParB-like and HNH nuclease domain
MAKTLEAHDKLIWEIFEGSYQFEILDYQRPYAWTTEQATELFDDLYSAIQGAGTLELAQLHAWCLLRAPDRGRHLRAIPLLLNGRISSQGAG